MNLQIIPSIIAHSVEEARERINKLVNFAHLFQLDVMDGTFVKEKSFMRLALDKLPNRHCVRERMYALTYESHLMLVNPKHWYLKNRDILQGIIVHYESKTNLNEFIVQVRADNKTIGIALNPETDAESVIPYLKLIDKILVMTVNPGRYGAPFISAMLPKIKRLRELAPTLDIEVDGGITPETLVQCRHAGANQFVVGSYLQNAKDIKSAFHAITHVLNV